jgi:hypothetical protein
MKINNYEVIPFDVEKVKAGWKPICRNGFEPPEVHVFQTAKPGYQVCFVDDWNLPRRCGLGGTYLHRNQEYGYDLFLIVPEPPARYVVEYERRPGIPYLTNPHNSAEEAVKVISGYGYKILATYKLVKI